MEVLQKQRSIIKGQMTRIKNAIDKHDKKDKVNTLTVENAKARLKVLEDNWAKYENLQMQIEMQLDDINIEDAERDSTESIYYYSNGRLNEIIATNLQDASTSNYNANISHHSPSVKLPILDLPKFSGEILNWLSFSDLFKALIDNNVNLTNVERLQYLKSSLSGEALKLIDSF